MGRRGGFAGAFDALAASGGGANPPEWLPSSFGGGSGGGGFPPDPPPGRRPRRVGSIDVPALIPPPRNITQGEAERMGEAAAASLWTSDAADDRMGHVLDARGGEVRLRDPDHVHLVVAEAEDAWVVTQTAVWYVAVAYGHMALHWPCHEASGLADRGSMAIPAWIGFDGRHSRVRGEANWFAAGFLMPADFLRRVWDEEGGDLVRVCRRVRTPRAPVAARALALGLVRG